MTALSLDDVVLPRQTLINLYDNQGTLLAKITTALPVEIIQTSLKNVWPDAIGDKNNANVLAVVAIASTYFNSVYDPLHFLQILIDVLRKLEKDSNVKSLKYTNIRQAEPRKRQRTTTDASTEALERLWSVKVTELMVLVALGAETGEAIETLVTIVGKSHQRFEEAFTDLVLRHLVPYGSIPPAFWAVAPLDQKRSIVKDVFRGRVTKIDERSLADWLPLNGEFFPPYPYIAREQIPPVITGGNGLLFLNEHPDGSDWIAFRNIPSRPVDSRPEDLQYISGLFPPSSAQQQPRKFVLPPMTFTAFRTALSIVLLDVNTLKSEDAEKAYHAMVKIGMMEVTENRMTPEQLNRLVQLLLSRSVYCGSMDSLLGFLLGVPFQFLTKDLFVKMVRQVQEIKQGAPPIEPRDNKMQTDLDSFCEKIMQLLNCS